MVLSCCLVREQSSLKAFWYVAQELEARDGQDGSEIMERRRVDDDYIASWFRYEPVSRPAPKPKSEDRGRTAGRPFAKPIRG